MMCYWPTDRQTGQWDRIKSPEMNSCIDGEMIFDKGAETIQQGKDSLLNKWCWENRISVYQGMKSEQYFSPYMKTNST